MKSFFTGCLIASILFAGFSPALAGGVIVKSACSTGYCAPPVVSSFGYGHGFVANKFVNTGFYPSAVTFVPSQVLLNGQVTTYGAIPGSATGYSYQGGYNTTPGYQPGAQPGVNGVQPGVNGYGQPGVQPGVQTGQPGVQPGINGGAQPSVQPGAIPPAYQNGYQSGQQQPYMTDSEILRQILRILSSGNGGGPGGIGPQGQVSIAQDFASCVTCHKPGGEGHAALAMFDERGQMLPEVPRYNIYAAISKNPGEPGFMPKGSTTPLSPETKERVRLWMQEGLNNKPY